MTWFLDSASINSLTSFWIHVLSPELRHDTSHWFGLSVVIGGRKGNKGIGFLILSWCMVLLVWCLERWFLISFQTTSSINLWKTLHSVPTIVFWNCLHPYLESLTLQSARIPDKFFSDLIWSYFPSSLYIFYDCSGLKGIYIKSSSLKQLKIINDKPVDLCHLHVVALKLEKNSFWLGIQLILAELHFRIVVLSLPFKILWHGGWSHLHCAASYLNFFPHDLQYVLPSLERSAKVLRPHAKTIEVIKWTNFSYYSCSMTISAFLCLMPLKVFIGSLFAIFNVYNLLFRVHGKKLHILEDRQVYSSFFDYMI